MDLDIRARLRIKHLEEENAKLGPLLDTYPEGELHINRNGKYTRYYQYLGTDHHGSPIRRYIPVRQKHLAVLLWEKGYIHRRIEENQQIISLDEEYLRNQIERKSLTYAGSVADDLAASGMAHISSNAGFNDLSPEYQARWQNAEYKKNPRYSESLKNKGPDNRLLRSKSEEFISIALDSFHIPYRYECQFMDREIYPDFTIMRPLDGKIIIWEHLGLWDDPSYRNSVYSKLEVYAGAGYIPGNNLILSFETKEMPFDYEDALEVVHKHIL